MIENHSKKYVDSLISYLRLNKHNSFKLETEITNVKKNKSKYIVIDKKNKKYEFDYIVLACHTDQSSKIIKNLDKNLSELLNKFRYQNNLAYLHFDQSLMPKNKLIWSSWNYSTNSQKQISCITYWMNKLQNLDIDKNIFVTLNPIQIPKENKIIISKPETTPNFIEARGIGLIEVPFVVSAKLFCFVKITNLELKRLPNAKKKHCFGKKIKMMEFNPIYNNESALFMSLRYGVKHNTI